MLLYIDSTNNLKTIVKLDKEKIIKTYDSPREQDVLGAIQEILKANNQTFKDISAIELNQGPGSFTGTRVGVTIANTLAFALRVKVNGKKPPVFPIYDQPPNITKPKK